MTNFFKLYGFLGQSGSKFISRWARGKREEGISLKRLGYLPLAIESWRYSELVYMLRSIKKFSIPLEKTLDLSSSKIFAGYLSKKLGADVLCTDIIDKPEEEVKFFKYVYPSLNIRFQQADATQLKIPDNTYDFVYSISVIEHIAEDGDKNAMKEMARVVKPGGYVMITVPYVPKYSELWKDKDPYGKQASDGEKYLFAKYYDLEAIKNRLLTTQGLKCVDIHADGERFPNAYKKYNKVLDRVFAIKNSKVKLLSHTFINSLWCMFLTKSADYKNIDRRGNICMTFQKKASVVNKP